MRSKDFWGWQNTFDWQCICVSVCIMAFYTTGQLMVQLRARTGGQLKNVWFSEILEKTYVNHKLNEWKYVFLLWTLIIIKQHKEVIRISGKIYKPIILNQKYLYYLQVSLNPLFNLFPANE